MCRWPVVYWDATTRLVVRQVARPSYAVGVPVSPRARFERGLTDVDRLMEIHTELGGSERGQRVGLEPLNRSAVVLLTAVWEGFVEDQAAEALDRLVEAASSPDDLPAQLRSTVAREIREDPHNLAAWKLAGDGWQHFLRSRLPEYADARARGLNTPDSQRVESLYDRTLGLQGVTEAWRWQRMTCGRAREKLDAMIRRRGDIAHGGEPAGPSTVQKAEVRGFEEHVLHLVEATERRVEAFLQENGAAPP